MLNAFNAKRQGWKWLSVAALLVLTPSAFAHPGHIGSDLASGMTHPLCGIDHVLAMLAVGFWAAQLGGRTLCLFPVSFLMAMVSGGLLGFAGIQLPYVESGIAASLLVLGVLVATVYRVKPSVGLMLVSVFAIFHGYAHGTELCADTSAFSYSVGFVFTTALLHLIGIAVVLLAKNLSHEKIIHVTGAAIAVYSLVLFIR